MLNVVLIQLSITHLSPFHLKLIPKCSVAYLGGLPKCPLCGHVKTLHVANRTKVMLHFRLGILKVKTMTETVTRGRPSKSPEQIRQTVFSALIDIIEEKGAAGVSIDELARQSQLAKKTIYKHFDNKDSLIKEMILEWTSTKILPDLPAPKNVEEVIFHLRQFFVSLTTRVLSRESVAIYKFLQNEVANKHQLLDIYREDGINNATALLERWLAAARSKGWINDAWPSDGAVYLLSLIVTPLLRDISLGLKDLPSQEETEKLINKILIDFSPLLLKNH